MLNRLPAQRQIVLLWAMRNINKLCMDLGLFPSFSCRLAEYKSPISLLLPRPEYRRIVFIRQLTCGRSPRGNAPSHQSCILRTPTGRVIVCEMFYRNSNGRKIVSVHLGYPYIAWYVDIESSVSDNLSGRFELIFGYIGLHSVKGVFFHHGHG